MPVPYYPGITITPNLGLSLIGMDDVIAQDMILIDAAVGGGGGGTPGGSNTNVQFNNAGSFGGSNNFTWTNVTSRLGLIGSEILSSTNQSVTLNDITDLIFGVNPSEVDIVTCDGGIGSYAITIRDHSSLSVGASFVVDLSGNVIYQHTAGQSLSFNADGSLVLSALGGGNFIVDAAGNVTIDGTQLAVNNTTVQFSGTAIMVGNVGSNSGILQFLGKTTGDVSVKVQDAAGTYNFNLPITPGSAGQVLTSQGGGSSAMTWTTPSVGTGTVTSFSAGALSPIFTTSVATSTTTPALTFTLSTQTANTFLSGPASGPAAAPTFRGIVAADIPSGTVVWNTIGNPSGNQVLAMGANTSTWTWGAVASSQQTAWDSSGNLALQLNTPASVVAVANSPILTLGGAYQNAGTPTFAADTWTVQNVIGSGTNGTSLLTFTHSGTTGQASILAPAGVSGKPSLCVGTSATGFWQLTTSAIAIQYGSSAGAAGQISLLAGTTTECIIGNDSSANVRVASQVANGTVNIAGSITTGTSGPAVNLTGNGGGSGSFTATSGVQRCVGIGDTNNGIGSCTFAPTSGTAKFNALTITPTINQTGGANGVYTAIMVNVTETAVGAAVNSLMDLQVGSSSKFRITNTGIVSVYDSVATVRSGIPIQVAASDLTAQSAAIAATTIFAIPSNGAGLYRVSYVATITTAATSGGILGGTNGFQVNFVNKNDSVAKTSNPTAPVVSTGNTTATTISGALYANCAASTNLKFLMDYTAGTGTAMIYDLSVRCEYLG